MSVYSLKLDDFSKNDYALIAIHTTLKNYRLTYFLNRHLSIQFSKANYNLDFKNSNDSFIVYEFLDKKLEIFLHLIENTFKKENKFTKTPLFTTSNSTIYLIPEKKKVDFFIKIQGNFNHTFMLNYIEKINKIDQVITSYIIDPNTLKSKEFLIF